MFSLLDLCRIFFLVDLIENKKLRNFVFDRLFDELSGKTYYPYGSEIWVVDFIEGDWYFQYNSSGNLTYNRKFFDNFFRIYSFSQQEYQKLLKFWFETNTEHQVNHISRRNLDISYYIDGIKRSETKKWSLSERFGFGYGVIRRYLNLKNHLSEDNIKLEHFLTSNGIS